MEIGIDRACHRSLEETGSWEIYKQTKVQAAGAAYVAKADDGWSLVEEVKRAGSQDSLLEDPIDCPKADDCSLAGRVGGGSLTKKSSQCFRHFSPTQYERMMI